MQLLLADERVLARVPVHPAAADHAAVRRGAGHRHAGNADDRPAAGLAGGAGKYLACLAFYVVLWLPTLVYLPVLLDLHASWTCRRARPGRVMTMAGVFLAALAAVCCCCRCWGRRCRRGPSRCCRRRLARGGVGGWHALHAGRRPPPRASRSASTRTRCLRSTSACSWPGRCSWRWGCWSAAWCAIQMVAALVSMVLGLLFIVAGFWRPELARPGRCTGLSIFFSVPLHFDRAFTRGVLDTPAPDPVRLGDAAVACS